MANDAGLGIKVTAAFNCNCQLLWKLQFSKCYFFGCVYDTLSSTLDSTNLFTREQFGRLRLCLFGYSCCKQTTQELTHSYRTYTTFNFLKAVQEALQENGPTDSGSWLLMAKIISFAFLVIACLDSSGAAQLTACEIFSGYILDRLAAEEKGEASVWPNTIGTTNWCALEL